MTPALPAPLGEALHARGLRRTPQRERVLSSVRRLGHATPEEVLADLRADGAAPAVDASTVYRALALLEELGLVARTALDRRADTFHAVEHGGHLHLVCDGCGAVAEAPADAAAELAADLRRRTGFTADVAHLALRGRCAACGAGPTPQTPEEP
ncbi:Fur family transcriptional regulator [Kineococcus sp. TRM81007]|uniref:Fur family transcriptional regulator n=1 Tax=Kineococcus sp. TRM81007 TaxID=2925831 RepID=UPI0035A99B89